MIATLAEWPLEPLAWWTALAGNLLAVAAMPGHLLSGHRIARRAYPAAR